MSQRRSSHAGSNRSFPRTARINEALREVIAEELELIGDERLDLFTVTGITTDPDLRQANVWYSTLAGHGDIFYRANGEQIGRGFLAWGMAQLDSSTEEQRVADAAKLLVMSEGMVLQKSLGLDDIGRNAL